MPFLYLPDALSLLLLLLALILLKRSSIEHLEQELNRLQVDLFHCRIDAALPPDIASCANLTGRIRSAIQCAGRISPARLLFVARLLRKAPWIEHDHTLPDWSSGLGTRIEAPDKRIQERLLRIQMECNMNLGVYYLIASISGWMLTARILFQLIRRLISRRGTRRVDWLFDMMERIFIRLGRRAHRLALLAGQD